MSLTEYILLAASSLFVIVDPLATAPAFLAMTPNNTPEQRLRTARLACGTAAVVLLAFSVAGKVIFKIFGITMPAFQIAASIVLLIIALDMLRVQRSRVQETREEKQAGTEKDDIAITPLAIPVLAGPGTIATAMSYSPSGHWLEIGVTILMFTAICAVTFYAFVFSERILARIGRDGVAVITRLMGLILSVIGVQMILDGIHQSGIFSP